MCIGFRKCGGLLFTLLSGQCVGGKTGKAPCEQDCNGTWGGTAEYDDCDQCTGREPCNPCDGLEVCEECHRVIAPATPRPRCSRCKALPHGQTTACTAEKCSCPKGCDGLERCKNIACGKVLTIPENRKLTCTEEECACPCKDERNDNLQELTPEELLLLDNVILDMQTSNTGGCLDDILMTELTHSPLSVKMDPNAASYAQYNPCLNAISFRNTADITERLLRAELFHAYQQRHYEGKLSDISQNVQDNNHRGGSNVEFEEKGAVMLIEWLKTGGAPALEDVMGLSLWMFDFVESLSSRSKPVELTQEELEGWFNNLHTFQEYHKQERNLSGKPVDDEFQPDALLALINICYN